MNDEMKMPAAASDRLINPWKKILFVFNPVAGRSQIRNHMVDILDTICFLSVSISVPPINKKPAEHFLSVPQVEKISTVARSHEPGGRCPAAACSENIILPSPEKYNLFPLILL